MVVGSSARARFKAALARAASGREGEGLSLLAYQRVGGGTGDERDVTVDAFREHVEILRWHRVVRLDQALDELAAGDLSPKVVVTFEGGFDDVYRTAWPLLATYELPFTVYVTTSRVGVVGPFLSWEQLRQLEASRLVTFGNHTHTHPRPDRLSTDELDRCTALLQEHVSVTPKHFAYAWGVPVPGMEAALRSRFRSAATGELGRNLPGHDPMRLRRIPVRRTDPSGFFAAKLCGRLLPERAYAMVSERCAPAARRS
jgi:peptidoglycan/xylan/chitin deacetylase (PgdA/CDA1 family)